MKIKNILKSKEKEIIMAGITLTASLIGGYMGASTALRHSQININLIACTCNGKKKLRRFH